MPLNVVGPGLYIPHWAGGVYMNAKSVGKNFIISSGCVLGAKGDANNIPSIGDNVECCIGSMIIGKVNVGSDSIIAPNSVVIKDIPGGIIVSGVPAIVIKRKELTWKYYLVNVKNSVYKALLFGNHVELAIGSRVIGSDKNCDYYIV